MTDEAVRAAQRVAGMPLPPEAAPPVPEYVGIVSRAVAIVLDLALINLVAVIVGASAALVMDTLNFPSQVRDLVVVIGGVVYFVWVVGYFVAFWMITAQTLGSRVMGFRVQHLDGSRVGLRRGVLRFGALVLSAIPLGAGFIRVLFDERRRGFHDRVAGTVVIVGVGDKPHQHLGVPTDNGGK
ncbi:MAG: RDD family protein [Solirubrobacteraceae bacterium]